MASTPYVSVAVTVCPASATAVAKALVHRVPQRPGEDHHLLFARPGLPGGEQFAGDLSRQELRDPAHLRIIRRPGR
ncbi:hypothetical protein ACWD1Z_32820 [Streptomyces sp. NPDC002784]